MFDDAPEEFLDTLMSTLMKDPVELPTSKNVVDFMTISKIFPLIQRFCIEKHLMNEPKDPFNRDPLTLEQLIPRPDLKARIEEYKDQKRQQKKSA